MAGTVVDVSLQYNDTYNEQVFALRNSINTSRAART